jgi:hypothetical protein
MYEGEGSVAQQGQGGELQQTPSPKRAVECRRPNSDPDHISRSVYGESGDSIAHGTLLTSEYVSDVWSDEVKWILSDAHGCQGAGDGC